MDLLHRLLTAEPLLALFITISLGYLVGKLRAGNFVLGGIAGTLLVGVVIGQSGVEINSGIKSIFFAVSWWATAGGMWRRGKTRDAGRCLLMAGMKSSSLRGRRTHGCVR